MLENIVDALLEGRDSLVITLKARAAITRRGPKLVVNNDGKSKTKTRNVCFPGATPKEAWNFS
jgi:hypothetical protein